MTLKWRTWFLMKFNYMLWRLCNWRQLPKIERWKTWSWAWRPVLDLDLPFQSRENNKRRGDRRRGERGERGERGKEIGNQNKTTSHIQMNSLQHLGSIFHFTGSSSWPMFRADPTQRQRQTISTVFPLFFLCMSVRPPYCFLGFGFLTPMMNRSYLKTTLLLFISRRNGEREERDCLASDRAKKNQTNQNKTHGNSKEANDRRPQTRQNIARNSIKSKRNFTIFRIKVKNKK